MHASRTATAGGGLVPRQVRGGKFPCAKFRGSPRILCGKFRGHLQKCCGVQGLAGSVELSHRFRGRPWILCGKFRGQFETASPGGSGATPGTSGVSPGVSGASHGESRAILGVSGASPGDSGATPGHPRASPGHPGGGPAHFSTRSRLPPISPPPAPNCEHPVHAAIMCKDRDRTVVRINT